LNIGERLRTVREQKELSQGDIEKRTGLLRCYISRVENGHTVPAIETLEKLARALDLQMYELFYEGEKPPVLNSAKHGKRGGWGGSGRDIRIFDRFRRLLGRMNEADRKLLLTMGKVMSRRKAH